MPTGRQHPIQKIRGGDPDAMNDPIDPYRNELGQKFTINDRDYQKVQLDSGATSATPMGAQKQYHLAYWKNRNAALVTNDARMAPLGIYDLAGVFPVVVTPGNLTAMWTGRSRAVSAIVDGSSFVAGDNVVSDTAVNGPQGTRVAAGTAVSPSSWLGVARGPSVSNGTNNILPINLMLPDFD
jgi:hypothetical protein